MRTSVEQSSLLLHIKLRVSMQLNVCSQALPFSSCSWLVLQAANCIQPTFHCPSRQLHRAFRPCLAQQQHWRMRLSARASECSQVLRSPVVTAASEDATASRAATIQADSSQTSPVEAVLAEAGLSQDAIGRILKQYPSYQGWDVQQRLLPAIQRWREELGADFLSKFERVPKLLLRAPDDELLKHQYLVSVGITSPERVRKRLSGACYQSSACPCLANNQTSHQ